MTQNIAKERITIRVDADVVDKLRSVSDVTGIPYQTIINRVLRESVITNPKGWPFNLIKE